MGRPAHGPDLRPEILGELRGHQLQQRGVNAESSSFGSSEYSRLDTGAGSKSTLRISSAQLGTQVRA